ncbi:GNAT family N-acetyltransferase [Gorillibacterium timonense]|uniref:GNAT family N-acetyltransferase n=1 Tax=Gorillibacterium timonense TaxID=1689269 RepID=UPI00071C3BEC|nr:GNAT family N-acetyltransferase [Gorillibacterium timonense]
MIKMMNGLTATPEDNKLFNELTQSVFGIDFAAWQARKVWGEEYECYSIVEGGVMLANASVMKMQLLIGGVKRLYLQLGAVAVRKEYRGSGLSRQVLEHILAKYEDTPMLLFANKGVTGFYPKFGFRQTTHSEPWLDLTDQTVRMSSTKTLVAISESEQEASPVLQKLELNDPKVDLCLRQRAAYSAIFDCAAPYSVNWFHLIYEHAEELYYVPEQDAMLVAEQEGDHLILHDVIAPRRFSLSKLLPGLRHQFPEVERIQFGFNPEWMGVNCRWETPEHDPFFVRGEFLVQGAFIFPHLLVT